jgi:hypothetical protein
MSPYLAALVRPLNLLVLLVAVAAGATVGIWLLPLGLVAYALAVWLAGRDPQAARQAARPRPAKLSSVTFRTIVEEIDRSQRAVEDAVAQAEGPLARVLGSVLAQTEELVGQVHMLASKGQLIEQYLAANSPAQLQSQIDNLDIQLSATSDAYTVQQLQDTRRALVDRQSNARALETYIGRIMAQLTNIDANLDNVLAEVIRLRTADAVSADSTSNQVAQRLSDLNADMTAFQSVLDTALTESGARP